MLKSRLHSAILSIIIIIIIIIIIFRLQFFYTRIYVVLIKRSDIGFSFLNTFSVSYWCGDFLWTQEMVQL